MQGDATTMMDIHQILKQLPHRYPILLVDRVLELEKGKRIKALKNVSINEPFFSGHFPHRPVMPGVLMLEALAQAAALLAFDMLGVTPDDKTVYYFAGIDGARFKRPVEPGDQLTLLVELGGPVTFVLMPKTRENSASIHLEVSRLSEETGMTLVNRFLSALCWKCDEPVINHYGWSGNPNPVAVPKHHIPFGYSTTDAFPNEIFEITDDKAKLAIALYREARSLDSVPFQFLSFFKILNIFWKDKYQNGSNEIIDNLRKTLPLVTDKESQERIAEIQSKEGDPAEYLYKSGRCAVAHTFTKPIVDPDDVTDLHRLSKDLWLMRNLTAFLIEREFGIQQSIWR